MVVLFSRTIAENLMLTFKRLFVQRQGRELAENQAAPVDNFEVSQRPVRKTDDPEMRNFMEKSLGGGKVDS